MPPDRRLERQAALRRALEAEGLDGLLVTHLPNIRYLTGFSGSAALLLVRHDTTILVTDFRYAAQATQEAGSVAVVEIDQRSVWERLGRVLAARPPENLGIEPHALTVREDFRAIRSQVDIVLQPHSAPARKIDPRLDGYHGVRR